MRFTLRLHAGLSRSATKNEHQEHMSIGADELKMHNMGSTPGGAQVTEDTICSTEMAAEKGHSALSELDTGGVLVITCPGRCNCKGGSATVQCADIITSGSCYTSKIHTECACISRLSCYIARRSGETTPYQSLGMRVEGTENGRAKKNGLFFTASIALALLAASGMLVQRTDAQGLPLLQVPPNNRIFGGKGILFPLNILLTRVLTREDEVIPLAMKMADCVGEEKGLKGVCAEVEMKTEQAGMTSFVVSTNFSYIPNTYPKDKLPAGKKFSKVMTSCISFGGALNLLISLRLGRLPEPRNCHRFVQRALSARVQHSLPAAPQSIIHRDEGICRRI
jgi:hypothetical protein